MLKHKRFILIGSAIMALVTLVGLGAIAFASGNTGAAPGETLLDPGFDFLDGEQAALETLDLAFQEPPPEDQSARPFIKERMRENLAGALGISTEELDEARWAALLATLEDAVAEGYLTQQAADRLVAQAIIRQSATRDELIAAGLGITVEEWQAAREEGKTARQMVDELGLDATTIGQNLAGFLEELILQAAADGLIDDQQAQRILEDEFLDRLARGLWRPWQQQQAPRRPR